jgi:hypothetical protein
VLEKFEIWLNEEKSTIEAMGYVIDIEKNLIAVDRDNWTICVHLDSDELIARITARNNGMCDLEILEVISEQTIFYTHVIVNERDNFNNVFSNFIGKLSK